MPVARGTLGAAVPPQAASQHQQRGGGWRTDSETLASDAQTSAKIIGSAAGALAIVRESIDPRSFERAAHSIAFADRVLFVGTGPSGLMAQYARYRSRIA